MRYRKRILAGLLSLVLATGLITPVMEAKALDGWGIMWPVLIYDGSEYTYRYDATGFRAGNTSYTIDTTELNLIDFPEGSTDFQITPEEFTGGQSAWEKVSPTGETLDLSEPVELWVYAKDGRKHPFFLMGQEKKELSEEEKEARIGLAERLKEENQKWWSKIDELESLKNEKRVEVGGYHPVHALMLASVGTELWRKADANYAYRDKQSAATTEDFRKEITDRLSRSGSSYATAETITKYLDTLIPYYLEYVETHRIASPVIESYAIGESKGIIDEENRTVTIRMPEYTDWNKEEVSIETPESIKTVLSMGSPKYGEAVYTLTPWEETTGVTYDGVDSNLEAGWGCGVNLSAQWTLLVEEGTPYNEITDFAVTVDDGTLRHASIKENNIVLNLPYGTDLHTVKTKIQHTGKKLLLDGKEWDGETADFSTARTISVINDTYNLKKDYTVTLTAEPSEENEILSYVIGDRKASIQGTDIRITIPYSAVLEKINPEISISEFASFSGVPDALAFDTPLSYTVRAQNGAEKTYTVIIHKESVNTEAKIKEFWYGGIQGIIDDQHGTIELKVPENTDITAIKSRLVISDYATVTPESGAEVDFTSPVIYTVTSQSGTKQTKYTVTVTKTAASDNPYRIQMETLVKKIVEGYEATVSENSDDWTLMDIGFYRNKLSTTIADLPAGMNLASRIRKIDTDNQYAMTTLARTTMMLTALGVNATKLDDYSDGKGFEDANGTMIHDLVSYIYNYTGGYTINGPTFALIALDMGNYSVPDNANWTREKLLEVLLNHVYGTNLKDIDMVGAIMYAIAPYQDDPVYGERVRAKLEEGVKIITGEKKVSGVDPMREDLKFFSAGSINSEAAGWVIAALCSMGIDPQTDPRFVDGKGNTVISQYMAYATEDGFEHNMGAGKNGMATYQACYVMQWYLSFLKNGGAGHPTWFYYQRFPFSRPLNTETKITGFELGGYEGTIQEGTEDGPGQIEVTVPAGMSLENVTPVLTLSEGATLKAPKLPTTLVADTKQTFVVLAEDGKTMGSYEVIVHLDETLKGKDAQIKGSDLKLQDASILKDIEILKCTEEPTADGADITFLVGSGVDITRLYVTGVIPFGAKVTPDILNGDTKVDLSDWNTITVVSGDETVTRTYRIRAEKKPVAGINSFQVEIDGETYDGVIDNDQNTIKITGVPSTANVKALAPQITLTEGTMVCSPLPGIPQNFSVPVSYTVSGDNMDSRVYTVHITDADGNYITGSKDDTDEKPDTPVSSEVKIKTFTVLGTEGTVDESAGLITVTLPEGTDVSAVVPTITLSSGCSVSPVSGEAVDLRSPRVYTVTNGTLSRDYTVIISFQKSTSQQLWEKMEDDSSIADHQVVKD